MQRTSDAGRRRIERFEGCRLGAYQDSRGIWTIGFGHTGPEVLPGLTCDFDQADRWMSMDLGTAEKGVSSAVAVPLNQNQFDALVSFVFNVGVHAFMNSTCLRLLNMRDYEGAANEMLRWWHTPGSEDGLKRRRKEEHDVFLTS